MVKQKVTIKHLGLTSTGKFAAAFSFIISLLYMVVGAVLSLFLALVSVVFGIALGDFNALVATLITGAGGLLMFLVGAAFFVVVFTISGFVSGVLGALAYNIVSKVSGGLSFDAQLN